jgi:MFS family permease
LIFGGALILFSHITVLPVALVFAILAGFGMMSQSTLCNTIIQTGVSAEMRGRAISFFAMAFFGMQPLGGLLIGTVSQYAGAPITILGEGIAAILIAVLFLPFLRKDILKEKDRIILTESEISTVNTNQ